MSERNLLSLSSSDNLVLHGDQRDSLISSGWSECDLMTQIPKNRFWTQVGDMIEEHIENHIPSAEYELLEEEFEEVRDQDLEDARLQVNQKKNRYGNILPYDQTRVKLSNIEGEDGSDYINATYVGVNSEYIAAQAPTPASFVDFWRMIYERNSRVIVMLTKEYEGRKVSLSL